MSETPRTDDVVSKMTASYEVCPFELLDHARQLERELVAEKQTTLTLAKEIESWEVAHNAAMEADDIAWHAQEDELQALRTERDALKAHAEAMALICEDYQDYRCIGNERIAELLAYRRDFPKEGT